MILFRHCWEGKTSFSEVPGSAKRIAIIEGFMRWPRFNLFLFIVIGLFPSLSDFLIQ